MYKAALPTETEVEVVATTSLGGYYNVGLVVSTTGDVAADCVGVGAGAGSDPNQTFVATTDYPMAILAGDMLFGQISAVEGGGAGTFTGGTFTWPVGWTLFQETHTPFVAGTGFDMSAYSLEVSSDDGAFVETVTVATQSGYSWSNLQLFIYQFQGSGVGEVDITGTMAATAGRPTTAIQAAIDITGTMGATSPAPTFAGVAVESPVWTLVGVAEAAVNASGNYTINPPAGTQQNDILIVDIAARSTVLHANADFTFPQSDAGGNTTNNTTASDTSFESGYCIRGASAPSFSFTRTGGSRALGTMRAYRSNRPGTPSFDTSAKVAATVAATGLTISGGITTAEADELLTTGVFGARANTVSAMDGVTEVTGNSGATDATAGPVAINTWTERSDRNNGTSPTVALACYDTVKQSAGSTGNLTATESQSALHGMIVMAFKHPPASNAQTLSPSRLTNGQTFFGPTITRGPVSLAAPLLTNAQSFFAPQVKPRNTLQPPLLTNSQTFFSPSVAPGAVTLQPGLLTNSQTFFGPVVSTGAALLPPLLVNPNTFFAPSVSRGAVTLQPGLLVNPNTFFVPTVTLGGGTVTLQPPLLTNANTFFPPTVSLVAPPVVGPLLLGGDDYPGVRHEERYRPNTEAEIREALDRARRRIEERENPAPAIAEQVLDQVAQVLEEALPRPFVPELALPPAQDFGPLLAALNAVNAQLRTAELEQALQRIAQEAAELDDETAVIALLIAA